MEDGLKQRIYENILRFLENYRYIKSTAEATIPNFIFQNSPLNFCWIFAMQDRRTGRFAYINVL